MEIEAAIRTAMAFETRIRDLYREAAETATDPVGKRVFESLEKDEQRHLDYLIHMREQWRRNGTVTLDRLETDLPAAPRLQEEMEKLKGHMAREDRKDEKQMLSNALKAELETSAFYRQMVDEMPAGAREVFGRFLEIEEGHVQAVQAELDHISHTGYWLDFKEFDME